MPFPLPFALPLPCELADGEGEAADDADGDGEDDGDGDDAGVEPEPLAVAGCWPGLLGGGATEAPEVTDPLVVPPLWRAVERRVVAWRATTRPGAAAVDGTAAVAGRGAGEDACVSGTATDPEAGCT